MQLLLLSVSILYSLGTFKETTSPISQRWSTSIPFGPLLSQLIPVLFEPGDHLTKRLW